MISQDLAEALSRLSLLPVDWQGRAKLVSWLDTLSTMQVLFIILTTSLFLESHQLSRPLQASDELDESQARQLSFDLESAYNDFNKILHSSWTLSCHLFHLCPRQSRPLILGWPPGNLDDKYWSRTATEIVAVPAKDRLGFPGIGTLALHLYPVMISRIK